MSKERFLRWLKALATAYMLVFTARFTANLVYIEANIEANIAIGFLLAFLSGGAFVLWIKGD